MWNRTNGLILRVAAAWLVACCARPNLAFADTNLSQLTHKTWRISDGSLPYAPIAIAQTRDGYIWVATEVQLLRFDGARFIALSTPGSDQMKGFVSLFADRDGSLWIGSSRGIFHFKNGALSPLKHAVRANRFVQTEKGDVWFAASRNSSGKPGDLCHIVGDDFECVRDPKLDFAAQSLAQDDNDGFWIAGIGDTVCHWTPAATDCASSSGGSGLRISNAQLIERSGDAVWFAEKPKDAPSRLVRYDKGEWSSQPVPFADSNALVQAMAFDRNNALWIGTTDGGVVRIHDKRVENLTAADGLSSNAVGDAMLDQEGSMWIVTSEGIDQFYARPIETWSIRQGLAADSVSSLAVDAQGRVYLGNEGALDIVEGETVRSIKSGHGLPGQTVEGMFFDSHQTLWLGVDTRLYKFDAQTFSEVPIPKTNGAAITVFAEDRSGAVWMRQGFDFFRISQGHVEHIDAPPYKSTGDLVADSESGVWACARERPPAHLVGNEIKVVGNAPEKSEHIFPPILNFDGFIWCFTTEGMVAWKDGSARTLGSANGLTYPAVYAAVLDASGKLWLMTDRSYLVIQRSEIDAWVSDAQTMVHPREYTPEDGAHAGASTFASSALLAPNGDLWFATDRFPQRIRPEALKSVATPPKVQVESIVADGKAVAPDNVPARVHALEIDYTALSFIIPQRIDFSYKLDDVDADWQQAGNRRQALYTDLAPGAYTFRVKAINADGVPSANEASVSYSVRAAFYQTWWFRILLFVLGVLLVLVVFELRKRQVTRGVQVRLYERLAERERIARDLHDTFFQGIQGLLLRFHAGVSALRAEDPAKPLFEDALDQSDKVMMEGRELVLDLRERLDQSKSLADVLRATAEDLTELHAVRFSMSIDGEPRVFQPEIREELFRIGKEAMLNAFRHARATLVQLCLKFGTDVFELRVTDDGQGVDASVLSRGRRAGHWGLPGMKERAERIGGTFTVRSSPEDGTDLCVTVPSAIAFGRARNRNR